jgi:hypothetical protein
MAMHTDYKKVLLMGRSGEYKECGSRVHQLGMGLMNRERKDVHAFSHIVSVREEWRLIVSTQNFSARDTSRLGATIDVEQSAVRFLGSLVLASHTLRFNVAS